MGFGNVPTETVIDATVSRQSHRGADFADSHQKAQVTVDIVLVWHSRCLDWIMVQADVGVGNFVDVALS